MAVNLLLQEEAKLSPASRAATPASQMLLRVDAWLRLRIPLLLALISGLYLVLSLDLIRRILAKTNGQFTFPLDDTYITMALAKNFAAHASWSLPHSSFQSATSTPAFLLLLAGIYRITGPAVWGPLLLSFAFGLFATYCAYRMLKGVTPVILVMAMICIIVLTPLPILGVLGMEHSLHIGLLFIFLRAVADALSSDARPSPSLFLLAAAMVATRYESLFVVALAGIFFLIQRQFRSAILLGLAGAAPVLTYGLVSVLHGCYWLPHSVSLKGYSSKAGLSAVSSGLGHRFVSCVTRAPYLGGLAAAMLVLLCIPAVRKERPIRSVLGIVSGAIFMQLLLADVGWVYRYDAYLVAASIAAIATALRFVSFAQYKWAVLCVVVSCTFAASQLVKRTLDAEVSLPDRSGAVYSQQFQMARFLAGLEPGIAVAANDVGAINFFADIHCTDLAGIADREIFWLKRSGKYSTDSLAQLTAARNVKIAVVYDSWFEPNPVYVVGPPLPSSWVRLQEWITPHGEYLGSPVVTFYAVDPVNASSFKQALEDFDRSLPANVRVLRGNECFHGRPCL